MSQFILHGPKYGAKKINTYSKPEILKIELIKTNTNNEEISLTTELNDLELYYNGSDILHSNKSVAIPEPIPDYLNNYDFILKVQDANHIKKYDNDYFEAVFSTSKLKENKFSYQNSILTLDLDTKCCSRADATWNYDYISLTDNEILTYIKSNNNKYNDISHINIKIYLSELGATKLERYFTKFPLI